MTDPAVRTGGGQVDRARPLDRASSVRRWSAPTWSRR